jgi:hypothetical protein
MTEKKMIGSVSVINWPPGSGSIIQDYGSADPGKLTIFTDPEHCEELTYLHRDRDSSRFLLPENKKIRIGLVK